MQGLRSNSSMTGRVNITEAKIIILGDRNVGKSSIVKAFIEDSE